MSNHRLRSILVVGPLPPPIGGATVTVQAFADEVARQGSALTTLINTSPTDYRTKTRLLRPETLRRTIAIVRQYIGETKAADVVLLFATNTFIFTLGPLLVSVARLRHRPFFLRPFGGALDLYLADQIEPIRDYMLCVLRAMDGVLLQTQQVQAAVAQLGCVNTHYVPGYRPHVGTVQRYSSEPEKLRLVYLSHIRREKGPLVLLDALRILDCGGSPEITCDFYGPVFEEDRGTFFQRLETVRGARYCGVADSAAASRLLAGYDALVCPTYFAHEGHPGVIIEAMQAGVPVISTRFRAIPELIIHGENGLLVPVRDSQTLAGAIRRLALDYSLREQMAQASYQKSKEFRAEVVVPKMLEIMSSA